VSHWSVASVATVKLITGAFDELKNDPTIGRAVALRRAEMAMLDPKNPPEFAHPLSGRRSCSRPDGQRVDGFDHALDALL